MRYKDAGVDLEKQREVHAVAQSVLSGGAGRYVRWVEEGGRQYALHVDGVGTKALWLLQAGKMHVAGWDCLAVNINDVVCDGFKPIAAVDYIAVAPGLENAAKEALMGLSEAARAAGVYILGGETAIMPDVVTGVDVVCTVLAVREGEVVGEAEPGDYIVGVESSGPHANGFSLLRRLFQLGDNICGTTAAEVFLKPVAMYDKVLNLYKEDLIKAAAHITGGGFTKIKRVLGSLGAEIELGPLPCWAEAVLKRGVPRDEAYRVFNMGVGMALITKTPGDLLKRLEDLGYSARLIGRVKPEGPVVVDGIPLA
ncbi:phosphoribosylformylglycinamidine cyclo-ligase (AIRS) (purM) [Pyrobaculum aerophilum str. IM2]|uniref:phosphoribosylformylglycinamidine cyclo-ligase n=2 Tax=Pyrobaculum aerophilum TaxID=13773 RepID=Q8ZZK0_PYRAE|nr:phosphoribosylformylglycinamidine cyclo-ligase [Pyrobaculum aerophilum]AAL62639.1 phosphoribosylformylglycinamidine cyclo-ligase (AIRS) (purM) [Pyrobaculum aerophilum str. IM2]HII46692.1 phosphoribosylformylglycinamidine cyclo-ligase [Pyrobaculum aerophilum]